MQEKLEAWSDDELAGSLEALVGEERQELVRILKHLAEFNRRRLAIRKGYPSLFAYCVKRLGFSEGETMRRLQTFRAAARFRVIYKLLERGLLNVTTVALLEPHLTRTNYHRTLQRALGLGKRDVERLVAELAPKPEPVDRIRHLGVSSQPASADPIAEAGDDRPPIPSDLFCPSAPETGGLSREPSPAAPMRVSFTFTADESLLRSIERARELLKHKYPEGRLEDIFEEALDALLEEIDPDRRLTRREARHQRKAVETPATGRAIPQRVKDEVWRRDGGACAFVGTDGFRCGARQFLEFDHVIPWAIGGRSDDPENIRLLCRAHNQEEGRRVFGDETMNAALESRASAPAVDQEGEDPWRHLN